MAAQNNPVLNADKQPSYSHIGGLDAGESAAVLICVVTYPYHQQNPYRSHDYVFGILSATRLM